MIESDDQRQYGDDDHSAAGGADKGFLRGFFISKPLIEIFSNDKSVKCERCGFTAYNDQQSCIDWCKYARECFGDEVYDRLLGDAEDGGKAPVEGGD